MKSPKHMEQASFYYSASEVVVLPAAIASSKPPVRIFLGSEDAQYRAERVFIYSIEKVRDPNRAYEIHIMKNLVGFERSSWRTGFTCYRYAIPSLAGGTGRAIYNDVDQIYLQDPALLFDAEMAEHGYLAVAASDTSVMLIDCERMLPLWNLHAAQQESKKELNQRGASQNGLWGPADKQWNARDFEYIEGETKVLHFTALHLQPWQPTPDSYSYHPHSLGYLWFNLEKKAIQEGYQAFTIVRPSSAFAALQQLHAQKQDATKPVSDVAAMTVSLGDVAPVGNTLDLAGDLNTSSTEKLEQLKNARWPQITARKLLERVPQDDIAWLLQSLFSACSESLELFVEYKDQQLVLADGYGLQRNRQSAEWWREQILEVANRFPSLQWKLHFQKPTKAGVENIYYQSGNHAERQSAWILTTQRKGDNAQLEKLAAELGWNCQIKPLFFRLVNHIPNYFMGASLLGVSSESAASLRATAWPDYVLSSGRRAAPVARWIKKASAGKTRLIHIGRPWCALEHFDLVITTPQYQLPLRNNVIHNCLPFNSISSERMAPGQTELLPQLSECSGPYLTVVIGGPSRPYVINQNVMEAMAKSVDELAKRNGQSVLICTSPRTPKKALAYFRGELKSRNIAFEWKPEQQQNAYVGCLSLADTVVVTGDSVSMISEICKLKKQVYVQRLPKKFDVLMAWARGLQWIAVYQQKTASYRGTPKQQNILARWFDQFVANGWLTSVRDLDEFLNNMKVRKHIRYLDEIAETTDNDFVLMDEPDAELLDTVSFISQQLNYRS